MLATLEWAPDLLRKVLQRIAGVDEEAFIALTRLVGEPPRTELVLSNIAQPAAWLREASYDVWQALALMAEEEGEWQAASRAWELAAERASDEYQAAGAFVTAAAAGHIGGDDSRRTEMLARAREHCARHPRLLIEDARDLEPSEQLDVLRDVELREPVDVGLVEAQRALSSLLLPDLAQAERHLASAREAMPGSAVVGSVEVNLAVQRARLNLFEGRGQQAAALRGANRQALALRDGMLRQRRWEESGRLLMLAADSLGLQGEFAAARELLRQATPDEIAAEDNAEILGQAAIRAFTPKDALRITEGTDLTDGVRWVRATAALEYVGSSAQARSDALKDLDALVAGGGRCAAQAALARLVDAMAHGGWSDAAESCLKDGGHDRPALVLRAFYLGERRGDWEGAYALFDDLQDRGWVLPARLRVAYRWGRYSVMKQAADDLMATGPGQALRLECGRAYARAGDYARAREVLMGVAEDESAPSSVRAEAYRLLVVILGMRLGDWEGAGALLPKWIEVRPGDTRASMVAPTIANRLARMRSG